MTTSSLDQHIHSLLHGMVEYYPHLTNKINVNREGRRGEERRGEEGRGGEGRGGEGRSEEERGEGIGAEEGREGERMYTPKRSPLNLWSGGSLRN